jgi:hypothetical protein
MPGMAVRGGLATVSSEKVEEFDACLQTNACKLPKSVVI